MSTRDPFQWPEDPRITDLRADRDKAAMALAVVLAALGECIAYATRHGGLCPVGQLRKISEEHR